MKYTIFYIFTILGVNYLFETLPLLETPWGDKWPPGSLVVGLIFVLRDFSQREIGHNVLFAMLIGALLSYYLASPIIAVASLLAFLISESSDWLIYTVTRRPFRDRILISSLISCPLDSAVFLWAIGHLSISAVVLMTISKLVAALIIWRIMNENHVGQIAK